MNTVTIHLTGNIAFGRVFLNGRYLSPKKSQKLRNHSPGGFSWGYGGSGPAQLALAVLLEITDQETALKNYQTFKEEVIAVIPQRNFNKKIPITEYLK